MSAARKEIQKLFNVAKRRGSHHDAEDAVQDALIRFWEEGARWREGRLVLEVKSQMRNRRRSESARKTREERYALETGGADE